MSKFIGNNPLVYTVKCRCRVCYTCVRECPVKAIKIINGQAEVITERCIACGNCVKVCSQGAKAYYGSIEAVEVLLESNQKTVACVAPAFPAEFSEINDYRIFVGMVKSLGFDYVVEVSFGADLVAKEYKKLLNNGENYPIISSDCPAIVNYISYYHPDLVNFLAPVATPIMATARIVRQKYGKDTKIVFIGPCVAKKAESKETDEVLTFTELRSMFERFKITPESVEARDFDPPASGKGAIFPISRGLLRNAEKPESLSESDIIVTHGYNNFREAIEELKAGEVDVKYLELLCCDGCIMGPGMSKGGRRFMRRTVVTNYVRTKLLNLDITQWKADLKEFNDINLLQTFRASERIIEQPSLIDVDKVLEKLGKIRSEDHLDCGACGYSTCREHATAVLKGVAEEEMCLPFIIAKLHKSVEELNISNKKLANVKNALKQSEKLASMGQLSAGIAHELNNPLGVITMYSNILKEETSPDSQIYQDLELIATQAERCKNIVGGLLNFARKNQVKLVETNIKEFAQNSIQSIIKPDNISVTFESNLKDEFAEIDPDQMMQVMTNLEKNAVEAMPEGGILSIKVFDENQEVCLELSDTGTGISKENMDKIFTPFFTTKEFGKGTGLGLPLIYGIIKMHKGKINVESNDDPNMGQLGTTFKIKIPRNQ